MRVMVINLKGTGVEVAKNLILFGPKQIILVDDNTLEARDMQVNFLARQESVNQETRAGAIMGELQLLNEKTRISQMKFGELDGFDFKTVRVVVLSDELNYSKVIKIQDLADQS